jgi:hypothetical protein
LESLKVFEEKGDKPNKHGDQDTHGNKLRYNNKAIKIRRGRENVEREREAFK